MMGSWSRGVEGKRYLDGEGEGQGRTRKLKLNLGTNTAVHFVGEHHDVACLE